MHASGHERHDDPPVQRQVGVHAGRVHHRGHRQHDGGGQQPLPRPNTTFSSATIPTGSGASTRSSISLVKPNSFTMGRQRLEAWNMTRSDHPGDQDGGEPDWVPGSRRAPSREDVEEDEAEQERLEDGARTNTRRCSRSTTGRAAAARPGDALAGGAVGPATRAGASVVTGVAISPQLLAGEGDEDGLEAGGGDRHVGRGEPGGWPRGSRGTIRSAAVQVQLGPRRSRGRVRGDAFHVAGQLSATRSRSPVAWHRDDSVRAEAPASAPPGCPGPGVLPWSMMPDPVAELVRLLHVVGVSRIVCPSRCSSPSRSQSASRLRVEPGRRLVQEQHRRPVEDRARHHQPLRHAAGQRVHRRLGPLGQLELLQQLVCAPPAMLGPHAEQPSVKVQVLPDRQRAVEGVSGATTPISCLASTGWLRRRSRRGTPCLMSGPRGW